MGISKPSLYGAFGNKEELFLLSLERYIHVHIARHLQILHEERDVQGAIRAFLRSVTNSDASVLLPHGCLIVNASADCFIASTPAPIRAAIQKALEMIRARLAERLQQGIEAGQLSASRDAGADAAYFAAVMTGLGVLAQTGTPLKEREQVIQSALRVLDV